MRTQTVVAKREHGTGGRDAKSCGVPGGQLPSGGGRHKGLSLEEVDFGQGRVKKGWSPGREFVSEHSGEENAGLILGSFS